MLKVILNAPHLITPFNEPARDLRIQNTPLWLHQRNVLTPYTTREVELKPGQRFPQERDEMIVYRDNIFFDEEYINMFIALARNRKRACRAAFSADDSAFKEHALPLSSSYTPAGGFFLADLWYYPNGPVADVDKLKILARALYEGQQILECSELVKVGKNCIIDPRAVIHGPTTIGDNVTINAGSVIENCIIGNNVNISQDVQLMLSVVGDGAFLPFRAALFMTTVMENSMIAQNTCLQMCVIGRNTFVGAGSTFTDYNLIPSPIRALDGHGRLNFSNRPVIGSAVGHNCRLGSGMIVYPARTIESDVVLTASQDRRVIDRDVRYEDSDHHKLKAAGLHRRLYPRPGERELETW